MTIPFRGQITVHHLRRSLLYQARGLLLLFGLLFILVNVSTILPLIVRRVPLHIGDILPFLFPNLLVLSGIWIIFIRGPQQTLKENRMFQGDMYGTADEEGIVINGNGFTSRLLWKAYIAYKLQGDVLLLYQSPQSFNVFPRSHFESNAVWEQFKVLVREQIPLSAPPQSHRWLIIGIIVIVAILLFSLLRIFLARL